MGRLQEALANWGSCTYYSPFLSRIVFFLICLYIRAAKKHGWYECGKIKGGNCYIFPSNSTVLCYVGSLTVVLLNS